jgi:hypothetical protein
LRFFNAPTHLPEMVRQKARRTQVAKSWRILEKREQNSRCNVHNRLTTFQWSLVNSHLAFACGMSDSGAASNKHTESSTTNDQ